MDENKGEAFYRQRRQEASMRFDEAAKILRDPPSEWSADDVAGFSRLILADVVMWIDALADRRRG